MQLEGAKKTGPVDSLAVDGFQAIIGVCLELDPGVNVIVGESDVGKSSLIRALQGLVENPRGDGFVNNKSGRCRVVVRAGDDAVSWSKPDNEYQVNDDTPFRKIGASVPDDVLHAVNMAPLELDKFARSINIVGQDDPKFMVHDKEADVARMLGAVTRLQPVYQAMRLASTDRRSASSQSKTLGDEASKLRIKIAAYADLDAEAVRIARAEAAIKICRQADEKSLALDDIRKRINAVVTDTTKIMSGMRAADAMLAAGEHLRVAKAAESHSAEMQVLRDSCRTIASEHASIAARLAEMEPAVSLDLKVVGSVEADLCAVVVVQSALAKSEEFIAEIESRLQGLAAIAGLDTDWIDEADGRLADIMSLEAALCENAASTTKVADEQAGLDRRIAELDAQVADFLESAPVCPLSGGRLFDECKELLKG